MFVLIVSFNESKISICMLAAERVVRQHAISQGFQRERCKILSYGNQKFEDISVLKALVQLRAGGLLHPDDSKVLIDRLQTDWGRQAAAAFLSDNHEAFAEARSLLRRFSVAA